MEKLYDLTIRLQDELERLKTRYETGEKKDVTDHAYFTYVQKETEHLFTLLSDWERCAQESIQKLKETVFPQQITATYDNVKAVILHSYYRDIRIKQYMKIYKACNYILQNIIQVIDHDRKTTS